MFTHINNLADLTRGIQINHNTLVYFWAAWCGPCNVLGKYLREIDDAHPGDLNILKVNLDEQPAIAATYGVTSVPTIILYQDGNQILTKNIIGVPTKDILNQKLAQLLDSNPTI